MFHDQDRTKGSALCQDVLVGDVTLGMSRLIAKTTKEWSSGRHGVMVQHVGGAVRVWGDLLHRLHKRQPGECILSSISRVRWAGREIKTSQ